MDFVNEETRLCFERVMRGDIGFAKLIAQSALARDLEGLSGYLGYWQDQFADDLPFDLENVALGQLSQKLCTALNPAAMP